MGIKITVLSAMVFAVIGGTYVAAEPLNSDGSALDRYDQAHENVDEWRRTGQISEEDQKEYHKDIEDLRKIYRALSADPDFANRGQGSGMAVAVTDTEQVYHLLDPRELLVLFQQTGDFRYLAAYAKSLCVFVANVDDLRTARARLRSPDILPGALNMPAADIERGIEIAQARMNTMQQLLDAQDGLRALDTRVGAMAMNALHSKSGAGDINALLTGDLKFE